MTSPRPSHLLLTTTAAFWLALSSCATKDGEIASDSEEPTATTPAAVSPTDPPVEEAPVAAPTSPALQPEQPKPILAKKKAAPAKPRQPAEPEKGPAELAKLAEAKVSWNSSQAALREAFYLSGKAADAAPRDTKIALQHARHALRLAQTEAGIDRPAAIANQALTSLKIAGLNTSASTAEAAYYHASLTGLVMQAQGLGAAGKLPKLEAEFKRATGAPGTDKGGPWRAMGMLYLKAPPWPTGIGDIELALENLEKAAQSYGGFPHNHICLARAYADDGSLAEAKQSLDRAENLLASGNWGALEANWRREIAEIRKLLT